MQNIVVPIDKRAATFSTSWWLWMPPAIFCSTAPCPTNTAKRWSSSFLAVVIGRRTAKTRFPRRWADSVTTINHKQPALADAVAERRPVAACVIERCRRPATEWCRAPLQRTDSPFRPRTMPTSRRKWRDSSSKRSSWRPITSIRITIDRWVYVEVVGGCWEVWDELMRNGQRQWYVKLWYMSVSWKEVRLCDYRNRCCNLILCWGSSISTNIRHFFYTKNLWIYHMNLQYNIHSI